MMYFCLLLSSFGALYSGQTFCVYMGCTDIDYCIYDICGLWMVLVFFYGYVYGYVYGCMFMDVFMDMFGYVFGYVFGSYVFGLCVQIPGLDPPRGLVQQISGLTSPWGPFPTLLGLTPSRGPFE
jgi:hypothetical protein